MLEISKFAAYHRNLAAGEIYDLEMINAADKRVLQQENTENEAVLHDCM